MKQERYLVVVVGPTAVGKTDFCVQLAKHFQTEIISTDSRQFFKELSIGTAKPTPQEQGGVPHHFINSHTIHEEYNAGQYEEDALRLLHQLFQGHEVVIATGGSGLYVRALCEGLDEMPEILPGVREELNQRLAQEGLPALVQQLQELDPEYAAQVDPQNPQRVVRALEVCLSSGQPYSSFRTQNNGSTRGFRIIKIGLTRERPELYDRINHRVDQMLAQGLLDEVKQLLPYREHQALQTVGYTELFGYLDGFCSFEEAVRLLKRNSRRYAKRQLTWFNRDPEFQWFHPGQFSEVVAHIQAEMEKGANEGGA
ncbi:tRNA (adenosine(37)-N6)-dimethylallyltransferase MiaA [Rufibacter glacialis]|uniref:tRNA dimethylallyltransferase n=1 Tax=Rufibacter glacialis TaxID=1259555 RepID=A0A5M8QCT6_9BACT|nr:tRNA (adenosine(37)-N6)-dimethylallyltransferase MiaA [Rufibacter glacialis]KAA6432566.1 tRNA (adenosine(37)-N6)-dimethylallyltransferase MiaA [Rufibacter glacialis]GGK79881.1 tRNA dimethylallyltransferase 1 [Rufibacter glacialis]